MRSRNFAQPNLPLNLIINLTAGEIPTVKVTIDGKENEYELFV